MFDIFDSKGVKRTLASIFAVVAVVAPNIPVIAPYAHGFELVAGLLGFVGVCHAAVSTDSEQTSA